MGAASASIAFGFKICPSWTPANPPNLSKFFEGCGAAPVTYVGTGIAWQPKKAYDEKTMTIGVFDIEPGSSPVATLHTFSGCCGNAILGAEGIGQPWMANFTFQGKYEGTEDVTGASILELTAPDTTLAIKHLNNPLVVGGSALCITSWQLDFGNDIQPRICQSEDTGYSYFRIASRRPRFSINPLAQRVADIDWYSILRNQTIQTGLLESAAATPEYSLHFPRLQLLSNAIAAREGYVNWDQTLKALRNGGVDSDIADEATWELLHGSRT